MSSYKIIVSGRVQGVNYRKFVKITAENFGIKGYVKNLENGDVEIICRGEKEKIEFFLKKLKNGNPYAKVDNIKIEKIKEIDFKNFEILYH
ncbi:MAG: acylphosphatase [Candidatus Pacearchaeota archaeon]